MYTERENKAFIRKASTGAKFWLWVTTTVFKLLVKPLAKRDLALGVMVMPITKKKVEKKRPDHLTVVD